MQLCLRSYETRNVQWKVQLVSVATYFIIYALCQFCMPQHRGTLELSLCFVQEGARLNVRDFYSPVFVISHLILM